MGTQREKVIVEAVDRVSKPMKQAESGFAKFSGKLKQAATVGGLVIAGAAIAKLGVAAIGMAVDADEAAAAFETTFGPAVDSMTKFVDEFANKAGFASFELEQMLAVTGNIAQGLGATEQESAALSQRMAILAGDIASFSNAAGGAEAVLAALQSATTGEREALKSYGLVMSGAEVEQQALTASGKSQVSQLSRLDKALATIELAYQKAGKAVGDLDRTQDSGANAIRRLQAVFKELSVEVGQAFMPILETMLPVLTGLIEDLGPVIVDLATNAAPLLQTVFQGIGDLLAILAPSVMELVGSVLELATRILTAVLPAVTLLAEALVFLVEPILVIADGLAKLFQSDVEQRTLKLAEAFDVVTAAAKPTAEEISNLIVLAAELFALSPDSSSFTDAVQDLRVELELTNTELRELIILQKDEMVDSFKVSEVALHNMAGGLKITGYEIDGFTISQTLALNEVELHAAAVEVLDGEIVRLTLSLQAEARVAAFTSQADAELEAQRIRQKAAIDALAVSLGAVSIEDRLLQDTQAITTKLTRAQVIAMLEAREAAIAVAAADSEYRSTLSALEEQLYDATLAQESLSNAMLEAASPAFAAVAAADRFRTAQENLDKVLGDTTATADEMARATLDLAEAALEAEVKFQALQGTDLEAALEAIALALDTDTQSVKDLLTELDVLDGGTTRHAIQITVPEVPVVQIRISIPRWEFDDTGTILNRGRLILHRGGIVPRIAGGRDVAALLQPGELVIPKGGLSTATLLEALNTVGSGASTRPISEAPAPRLPPITIEIPVSIDGREVARVTAPHITQEITNQIGRWHG